MPLKRLWESANARLFGGGFAGAMASAALTWFGGRARRALRNEPERIGTVKLEAGEQLQIVTRPPLSKKERRLGEQKRILAAELEKRRRLSRRTRDLARETARATRRVEKAKPGSRKARRREKELSKLRTRLERRTAPSRKEQQLAVALDFVDAQLAAEAEAVENRARRKKRRASGVITV